MLLALLCVGIFLVQLDVTVVNVALPTIRTDLQSGAAGQHGS
jgi:DHA2 family methylenomycin A resistance protein-like MFS transporter